MAAFQTKENSGSLFQNDRKQNNNHPDYTGKVNVDGVEYYISGWKKLTKNNQPRLSLSFKPVNEASRPVQSNNVQNNSGQFQSDDIPF